MNRKKYSNLLNKTVVLPFSLIAGLSSIGSQADANKDFEALLKRHWQQANVEKVFFRTDPDGWKPQGKLEEFSSQAIARRRNFNDKVLQDLEKVAFEKLDEANKISYRIFKYERDTEQESYKYQDRYFPINFLSGWHTYFADAPENMAFDNAKDYDDFLISLEDYPRFNAENISLMKEGVVAGFVHHCESFKNYHKTIALHIVDEPENSALFEPFTRMPSHFSDEKKNTYSKRAKGVIRTAVIPAYREFYDFFTGDYMPKCRKSPGISSVEGGAAYYDYAAKYYTTTTMSPKEIHQLGLEEVARIRKEMVNIIDSVGFKGSYSDFLKFLAEDPQFYARNEQDVLEKTAFITQKMYGQLPRFFNTLPRNTFIIKGTAARGAFYMPPPDKRTPGTYFLSTEPRQQPLYNLEALSLHEALPGHHLQTAIAMELDVPHFRRTVNHSAFSEGWALYSERLGKEAGFYTDPYSDFGRLGYEMWRAVRLVVDTGVHAFGWSRARAIEYLAANTALTDKAVEDQIDRYISWPAQALSYKIGELKIRELRSRAERVLGAKFNIRSFHDMLIGQGSMPLDVLEDMTVEWIAKQESKAFPTGSVAPANDQ